MKKLFVLAVISLSVFTQAHAEPKSDLLVMNESQFKTFIQETKGVVVLLPGATWCRFCRDLEPDYEKAATDLKGLVTLVKMDYDQNVDFMKDLGIESLPQTEVYSNGSRLWEYHGGFHQNRLVFEALQARDAVQDGSFEIKRYTLLKRIH